MAIGKEFREFISRGNVIDLAVGVIIGAAFGKIVSSLVSEVIMPPIGLLLGKVDFSSLYVPLRSDVVYQSYKQAKEAGYPMIAYGTFLNVIIEFIIVAACVFLVVKGINSLRRKEEAKPSAPPEPTKSEVLLEEIRDLLKKDRG